MSKSILDELYDYDLFHLTETKDTDGAYKAVLDRFDEYQSANIELHNHSNRNKFCKGFKVGTQLVLEMIKFIK